MGAGARLQGSYMDANSPWGPYLVPDSGEGEVLLNTYCVLGMGWLWGYIRKKEVVPAFGASGAGEGGCIKPTFPCLSAPCPTITNFWYLPPSQTHLIHVLTFPGRFECAHFIGEKTEHRGGVPVAF